MSDDEFEFVDDGPSRPKNPGIPGTPPPQDGGKAPPPAQAGFNPFSGVEVKTGQPGVPPSPPAAPADGAPPPGPVPVSVGPVGPGAGAADATTGNREDLWQCPHCGAKNKPERNTCRSCDLAPDDEPSTPWHRRPVIVGAGAVVLVLILVALIFGGGPDFTLLSPTADNVSADVIVDGSPGPGPVLDGEVTFDPRGRIAGVGRVIATSNRHQDFHGTTTVAMVFGRPAAQPETAGRLRADFERADIYNDTVPADVELAFIHFLDPTGELPAIPDNALISFSGTHGVLEGPSSWGTADRLSRFEYVVHASEGLLVEER
ncbi:MAG: zinc finger Ran-binding domain-containing protein [Planctomycetota bacterium]